MDCRFYELTEEVVTIEMGRIFHIRNRKFSPTAVTSRVQQPGFGRGDEVVKVFPQSDRTFSIKTAFSPGNESVATSLLIYIN